VIPAETSSGEAAASVDASYLVLAAKYIRRQAKQLAAQLDGVCTAEDIEFVHRARVASRRLRAGMRMFADCFDAKLVKRWRKQIRRLTSELGDARDIDVQIEFLCGTLHAVTQPACYPGIARLLVRLEHRRELLQSNVVRAVDRLRAGGVLTEMQAVAKKVLAEPRAEQISVQCVCARRHTEPYIRRKLKQMLRHQESLSDPDDQAQHHAMRIAAKRLRYTLEIAKPAYGQLLDPFLDAVKTVQTLLGDVHDCDVWVEQLQAFAEAQRENVLAQFGNAGPFARLNVGIEYLRQDRHERRVRTFEELVAYWQELSRQGQWENLLRVFEEPGLPPTASEPPTTAKQPAKSEQPATAAQPAAAGQPITEAAAPPTTAQQPIAVARPAAAELSSPHWPKFAGRELHENRPPAAPRAEPSVEPSRPASGLARSAVSDASGR
jgi:CHAD domain-containing protein